MAGAQFLDDTFSDDVVRQAAERLGADDVRRAVVNQFQHLTGQEPSLAGLIAEGNVMLRHRCQILNPCRRKEMCAAFQFAAAGAAEILQQGDSHVAQVCGGTLAAQIVGFEVAVVEAVKQEIKQIRHYSFGTLGFQKLYHVVVC